MAVNCGVDRRCGSDHSLLWLWHRPAGAALIGLIFSSLGQLSYTLVYLAPPPPPPPPPPPLVTLPVEFNASHRALAAISQTGLLTEEEQQGARKTLQAAALTYVAATATALAQLLRLIILFGNRGSRRDD